jgi:uncharacterized protein involved in outer membrane biogenesis
MNNALLWLGGLLVAVLCALFAVPHLIDWNRFRGVFEEEASRVLGREIRVDGDVRLRLLPTPYVEFGKVSLADAQSVIGEPFFRARSFKLRLAVSPLLRGAFEVKEIALQAPVLKVRLHPNGGGNWQTLRLSASGVPFLPGELTLQSVNVSDGVIEVIGAGDQELARIEAISGEASAEAIEGPYRFRADFAWHGEPREVRGSTARQDPDGGVRIKAAVRALRTGSSYALDGKIADLTGRTRLDGELTAKLPVGLEPAPAQRGPGEPAVFDMKSALALDTSGARLSDIALSFEQNGKPQLVTGTATVAWGAAARIDADLSSRWLDLDRIAGSAAASPPDALRRLLAAVVDLLPAEGRVIAAAKIDQINLGGDVVSGVRLALDRPATGPLALRELSAGLPGGSRLDLKGALVGKGEQITFDGEIGLRGSNFGRFLGWAAKGYALPEGRGDAAFDLRSRLAVWPGAIELTDTAAELAQTALTGGIAYRWLDAHELALTLDGAHIDLSAVAPGVLDVAGLRRLVWADTAAASGAPTVERTLAIERAGSDVRVRVRAQRLTDGTRQLDNVDAEMSFKDGLISIPKLRFSSEGGGVQIEVEGQVRRAGADRKGQVRGVIATENAAAAVALVDLLALPPSLKADAALPSLAPFRLAYIAGIGQRVPAGIDLRVDGTAAGSRIAGSLQIDGGVSAWSTAPISASVTIDSRDTSRIAALLVAKGELDAHPAPAPVAGRLTVRAAGPNAGDLATFARLEAGEDRLGFTGRASVAREGITSLAGEAVSEIADLGRALAAVNVRRRPAVAGVPLEGRAAVAFKDGKTRIAPRGARIAASPVSGAIDVATAKDRLRIDARLELAQATVPALLAIALGGRPRGSLSSMALAAQTASATSLPANVVWPDQPFDFSVLDGIEGRVALGVKRVALDAGLALSDATIEGELFPNRIVLTRLEGRAMGGTAKASARIDREPAGASLAASLVISGARIDTLAATTPPAATGRVALQMQVAGRALTPRSLIAGLTGKGDAEVAGVRMAGLTPSALAASADAVIAGKSDASGPGLRSTLAAHLAAGSIAIDSRKLAFEIADGVAKVRAFSIEGPDGRVGNQTTIDLVSLRVDSEWRIEPAPDRRPGAPGKAPLPGITVVHVGALGALHRIEPRITADGFEREIAVRKMERDVEDLERLRKLDEERAKAEAERRAAAERQRLEIERTLQATQPAPHPVPQPPPVGAGPQPGALPPATGAVTVTPLPPPATTSPPQAAGAPDEPKRRPASSGQSGLIQSPDPQRAQPKLNPFGRTYNP